MKLQEAINKAIQVGGKEILTSKRFVYILDDLGAFREECSYRTIIRILSIDGYIKDCIEQKWTNLDRIIYSIIKKTGFQRELVETIIKTLSYCYNIGDDEQKRLSDSEIDDHGINKRNMAMIRFMGIRLGENLRLFIKEFQKRRYTLEKQGKDNCIYKGIFARKFGCSVQLYFNKNLSVYQILVHSRFLPTVFEARDFYFYFVRLYKQKYGDPKDEVICQSTNIKLNPYCEFSFDDQYRIEISIKRLMSYIVEINYYSLIDYMKYPCCSSKEKDDMKINSIRDDI